MGEQFSNMRILILEDDPFLALDLEDFLIEHGATVIGPVSSVEDALRLVAKGVDCAILDLNLRGIYSYPVIDRLAQDGTPFVICSGYAELPDMQERLRGATMLPKPCDFDRLKELLLEKTGHDLPQPANGKRMSATSPLGL